MAPSRWRSLLGPGAATLAALAALLSLGLWQLDRKAWKDGLVASIEARAFGEPASLPPESGWDDWRPEADEYRRIRISGAFLHEHETAVHGLMPASHGQPVQGFYLLTPLRLSEGGLVIVNRGFVPSARRDPARRPGSQPAGDATVTGLLRAAERPGRFTPASDPAKGTWFIRDPAALARAKSLDRVAPFLIDADDTPNPGGWPRGGLTRLSFPNSHLGYALTWFGLALALAVMFGAFAWRRLADPQADPNSVPS